MQLTKKIVVLTGSFRADGNTARLAGAFIKGAEAAGHEVKEFNVAKLNIKGCLDCKYCHSHEGVCIQKDDMYLIHNALREADVAVLASPIYYAGISGQLKCVIDRLFVEKGKKFDTIQKAYLLLTYASDTGETVAPCITTMHTALGYLGWNIEGVVEAAGVYGAGEVEGTSAMAQAEELGRNV